jgi:hypothetical protein
MFVILWRRLTRTSGLHVSKTLHGFAADVSERMRVDNSKLI